MGAWVCCVKSGGILIGSDLFAREELLKGYKRGDIFGIILF